MNGPSYIGLICLWYVHTLWNVSNLKIISAASVGSVASIGYAVSFISFSVIGIAVYKYSTRYRELTRGVTNESLSDFLDMKTPVFLASILTLAVVVGIIVAIHDWELSRYS
jgi:hypothetical protein